MNKKYNTISEIPERNYQGYVWLSDQKEPKVLFDEEYDFSKHNETENPFIIEALLYAEDENISVSVKHTGKYCIHEMDLRNLPEGAVLEEYADNDNKRKLQYLPHRLPGVLKVKFKQLWLPVPDENCEDWDVLKMKVLIFTGFNLIK